MLRRPRSVIFADIIKIVTILIKTLFKGSKKDKRIRNNIPKMQSVSVFLDIAKFTNFR